MRVTSRAAHQETRPDTLQETYTAKEYLAMVKMMRSNSQFPMVLICHLMETARCRLVLQEPHSKNQRHQEYQITYSPDHEYAINEKVMRAGGPEASHMLMHGSFPGNWYGIMQNGLMAMSGTALQTSGARFGPGVYLTQDPALALEYSGGSKANRTLTILVCEVITSDLNQYSKSNGWCHVVPDVKLIVPRHVLIFPKGVFALAPDVVAFLLGTRRAELNTYQIMKRRIERRVTRELTRLVPDSDMGSIKLSGAQNYMVRVGDADTGLRLRMGAYPYGPPILYRRNSTDETDLEFYAGVTSGAVLRGDTGVLLAPVLSGQSWRQVTKLDTLLHMAMFGARDKTVQISLHEIPPAENMEAIIQERDRYADHLWRHN